jgi:hypothetical protein
MLDRIARHGNRRLGRAFGLIGFYALWALLPPCVLAQGFIGPVLLNQHGITGSWYNPQASGQDFGFEVPN